MKWDKQHACGCSITDFTEKQFKGCQDYLADFFRMAKLLK